MKGVEKEGKSGADQSSYDCYSFDLQGLEPDLHRHSRYELVFIVYGRGRLQIGLRSVPLETGHIVVLGPGVLHSFESAESMGRLSGVVVHFSKQVIPTGLLNLPEAEAIRSMISSAKSGIVFKVTDPDRIRSRMVGLTRSRGMFRLSRLHVLLDLVAQQWSGEVVENEQLASKAPVRSQARLEAVKRYLKANCERAIGRADAAAFLGLEVNAFSRFFHEAAGVSFNEYLSNIRIQKAANWLLSRKDFSIPEVARRSGFQNQSAFNRQFKRRLGMTPTAYRNAADMEPLAP